MHITLLYTGKTSLLNILAGRCPGVKQNLVSLNGHIYVNGEIRNENKFRSISAYVLQDDNMYAHLTVCETFTLAARFYLPDSISTTDRTELVDAVISELGLNKCRNTIIGDEKVRGVSGGERRRASIGVQVSIYVYIYIVYIHRVYTCISHLPYTNRTLHTPIAVVRSSRALLGRAHQWPRLLSSPISDGIDEEPRC